MIIGVFFIISACFLWGLIFVVPQFMGGFSPFEVAIGRYFFYGLLSCFLACFAGKKTFAKVTPSMWQRAFWYGLLVNIIYYQCLVCSIRYATPVIATLIFGLSPITIALFGNWSQKECSYKSLILPILAITCGLILVNWPALQESSLEGTLFEYLLGIGFGIAAVGLWTYYAISNSSFLKKNSTISSGQWSTIVGVATFAWILVIVPCCAYFFYSPTLTAAYLRWTPELQSFLLGSMVLGIISTWIGIFFWNKGCSRLPVSFAGQLTIFETIFGLTFVYLLEQRLPSLVELCGITIMLSGLLASIHTFKKIQQTRVMKTG